MAQVLAMGMQIIVLQHNHSLKCRFVKFSSAEEATQAIRKMGGYKIHNKKLLCKLSNVTKFTSPCENIYIKPLPPVMTECTFTSSTKMS